MTDFKQAKRNRKFDRWIVVSLLISLFLGLNYVIAGFKLQFDLTPKAEFSLSKQSIAQLETINFPIDIIVTLENQSKLPKIIQQFSNDLKYTLEAFERSYNKSIKVTYADINSPKKDNDILDFYKITQPNLVIVATRKLGKKIIFHYEDTEESNPYDLSSEFRSRDAKARQAIWESGFYLDWKEGLNSVLEPHFFRGEEKILKSILNLTQNGQNKRTAYFSTGHGEKSPSDVNPKKGYSEFRRIIEDKYLSVSTIDLSLTDSIPTDCNLFVIAGPRGTFQDREIALLRNFLNSKGGNLIIALDPVDDHSLVDRPALGLRPLLKEFGIRCHDMLIYDENKNNFDYFSGSYNLKTYSSENVHPIVKEIMEHGYIIEAGKCRPVESSKNNDSHFSVTEFLFSSKTSFAIANWTKREIPPLKNELLDLDGPVPVIAASEAINQISSGKKTKSKIIVVGNSDILSNSYLGKSTGNQLLARNIIDWFNDNNTAMGITPRKLTSYSISLNAKAFTELLLTLAFVPISVGLLGGLVSWLRKEL